MTAGSPAAWLLWAVLSCIFQIFMTFHLWAYDKFKCIKWSSGRQPGAFKRVMTYTYIATVPMLVVFSIAMSVIKYQEGYTLVDGIVTPKPLVLWSHASVRWVLGLYFLLSFAWAFEIATHLEELTFWLFLLHQGPRQRLWFHSWEFRLWYLGSMVAVLGIPTMTLLKRDDLDSCLAWIFLLGTSASTATTCCFLYVIARFPPFIRVVKAEGAEPAVVHRLATFYHLNIIRVGFRFMFHLPLLIIGVDGLAPPYTIINQAFWADFLLMVGAIGTFVSSALTLLIFFPRSFVRDAEYNSSVKVAPPPFSSNDSHRPNSASLPRYDIRDPTPKFGSLSGFRFPPAPASEHSLTCRDLPLHHHSGGEGDLSDDDSGSEIEYPDAESVDVERARRGKAAAVEVIVNPVDHVPPREEADQATAGPAMHPYVMSYTSPIDLWYEDDHDLPRAI